MLQPWNVLRSKKCGAFALSAIFVKQKLTTLDFANFCFSVFHTHLAILHSETLQLSYVVRLNRKYNLKLSLPDQSTFTIVSFDLKFVLRLLHVLFTGTIVLCFPHSELPSKGSAQQQRAFYGAGGTISPWLPTMMMGKGKCMMMTPTGGAQESFAKAKL